MSVTSPVRVLFLSASPLDKPRTQGDLESNEIAQRLKSSTTGSGAVLKCKSGITPGNLLTLLVSREEPPTLVHFSGHGEQDPSAPAALVFQTPTGGTALVNQEALEAAFKLERVRSTVRCVVLNACYTEPLATALARYVDCAIGVRGRVSATAAVAFAGGFYTALGDSCSLQEAFEVGLASIPLETAPEGVEYILQSRQPELASQIVLFPRMAAVPTEPTPGGTGTADAGMDPRTLSRLQAAINDPVLRQEYGRFETLLDGAQKKIAELNLYKLLHDELQMIELPYTVIFRQRRRVQRELEASWFADMREDLMGLYQTLVRLKELWERPPLEQELSDGKADLDSALSALKQAVDDKSLSMLDIALRNLGALFSRDLQRANQRLVAEAKRLELADLLSCMTRIHGALEGRASGVPLLHNMADSISRLSGENKLLEERVQRHNRWQQLENASRRITDALLARGDISEVSVLWEQIEKDFWPRFFERLRTVRKDSTDPEVTGLEPFERELPGAIKGPDRTLFSDKFKDCASACGRIFRRIDKELLSSCTQLTESVGRVAEQLGTLRTLVSSAR